MGHTHAKLIVIGSGPAGYTAAIYAARALLEPVMIAGFQPGGQLMITTDVENYPGFADVIQGPWLMEQMRLQAEHVGTRMISDHVVQVELGMRPFRITGVVPRQSVTLARNDAYWDAAKKAKVDQILLLPIPEPNTRLAALRSGRVDWIEVPPPDGIPSLKQAGFVISTGSYPHVWPWFYNMAARNSPLVDVKVRQGLNYCIDRSAIDLGPDLTHVSSRMTIAGASLAQNRGNLAGWIVDSQHVKPGNQMPTIYIDSQELQDLLAYIESLR